MILSVVVAVFGVRVGFMGSASVGCPLRKPWSLSPTCRQAYVGEVTGRQAFSIVGLEEFALSCELLPNIDAAAKSILG